MRRIALVILIAMNVPTAFAESVTMQDMRVIGRAISFVKGADGQASRLVVVFDRSNPASVREMETALKLLGSGIDIGGRQLSAVAVDQSQLGSARSGDVLFSTSGTDQRLLRRHLLHKGVPCFTLEMAQVRDGACTVAIRSQPKVTIFLNPRNASTVGVSFATAFIMMVQEV